MIDTPRTKLQPVRHRLELPLAPADAFTLFTAGMARWWPFRGHSCSGERALDVEFEPRVGGAVVEITNDGQRHPWGTVTLWEPPLRLAMTWHPAQPVAHATRLEVSFVPCAGGCELHLEHGGWEARGDQAADVRDGYQQGWGVVLARLAAAAKEGA